MNEEILKNLSVKLALQITLCEYQGSEFFRNKSAFI